MAQIEEVQFVNWGSIRPDIVPLAAPGITMVVGPNGSGKTCWLDGIKVLLGVGDLGPVRTPASYIFDGGPSGVPADEAWLRATFVNPVVPGQRHRVFAAAGDGCQDAEHVTVICRVQGDQRGYQVRPGRVTWGRARPIQADVDELRTTYRNRRWYGPQQYDGLLDRAGITKAVRGVLALPQGQTDKLVTEQPTGLMRRLLDLTGRQQTLEEFRLARIKHDGAVIAHSDAERRYEAKQIEFDRLELKVQKHREWAQRKAELDEIDEVLLPAARHFQAEETLDLLRGQLADGERVHREAREKADELWREHEAKTKAIADAAESLPGLDRRVGELSKRADDAVDAVGQIRGQAKAAWRSLDEARSLVAGVTLNLALARVEECEREFALAYHRHLALGVERSRRQEDLDQLRDYGSMAPREVVEFCARLSSLGCAPRIVGDVLSATTDLTDIDDALRAQAALGDALWGIAVPDGDFETACREAVAVGLRWPLVREGGGSAKGVLSAVRAPEFLGRLLAELDAMMEPTEHAEGDLAEHGLDTVTTDGMRHGPTISRLAPEHDAVLDIAARRRRMGKYVDAIDAVELEQTGVAEELVDLRARLLGAYSVRDAATRREALRTAFRDCCADLVAACERRNLARAEHRAEQARVTELRAKLAAREAQAKALQVTAEGCTSDADGKLAILKALEHKRTDCELALESNPLPIGFTDGHFVRLVPESELVARKTSYARDVADLERYPAEVRDPLIVEQLESEGDRLQEVKELIEGKSEELVRFANLVAESRARYDKHIGALVRELRNRFAEICTIARIEGDIRLIPGDTPEDYGVDVLVSHKEGEAPVSYLVASHSGGQRTKIAILLLLAAMSLGKTADLLIVDEHQAHLDGTNSGQIIEIMRNLSKQAQFILSAPTSGANDDAVGWCDLQIAFLPRLPGELHSPPLRLMSRVDAARLEQRFVSKQQPLI